MKKRWFAWFLAAVMLCALLPASALASVACTFEFTTETLADGLVGAPYNDKIEWKSEHYDGSGSCDVVFMLDENSDPLPDGLTLNEDGTISGTPTTAGEYKILVNAMPKVENEHSGFLGAEHEYTIKINNTASVVIPFTKVVQQGGNTAPGAATFQFELYDFGFSGDFQYEVTGNTVATNGAGTYCGRIVINVPENELGNLSEGFMVREVNDGRANWTYAPETWYVRVYSGQEEEINVWISKAPGENESFDAMTFTNVYTYNEYYQPTPTPEPDLPQTGDSGSFAFMAALALFAAAACTVRLCTKKH